MATSKVSNRGATLNLEIRQGADFAPTLRLKNPTTGLPVDLTGAVLRAQIRKTPLATAVVKSFAFDYVDRPNGIVVMKLTAAETASIKAVDDPKSSDNKYFWDLEMGVGGFITHLVDGEVMMYREVTR